MAGVPGNLVNVTECDTQSSLTSQANEPARAGLAARNPMFPFVDMGTIQASRLSFLSRKERGGDIQDGPVAEIIAIL